MTVSITRLDLSASDLRGAAAEACAMDRQTLCDWVHRYNALGLEGLFGGAATARGLACRPNSRPKWRRGSGRVRSTSGTVWCAGCVSFCSCRLRRSLPSSCTNAWWANCCAGCRSGGCRCGLVAAQQASRIDAEPHRSGQKHVGPNDRQRRVLQPLLDPEDEIAKPLPKPGLCRSGPAGVFRAAGRHALLHPRVDEAAAGERAVGRHAAVICTSLVRPRPRSHAPEMPSSLRHRPRGRRRPRRIRPGTARGDCCP